MAGCVPCFIIPLLLFIFHRYLQPIILKFWNPWEDKQLKADTTIRQDQTELEKKKKEELKVDSTIHQNQTELENKKDM